MSKQHNFTMISSRLEEKPRFIRLAKLVGRCMARGIVLGAWMHADSHAIQTEDGALLPAEDYKPGDLDLACGAEAEASLEAVGWLEYRKEGILLPGFSCEEMRRLTWAAAKAEQRERRREMFSRSAVDKTTQAAESPDKTPGTAQKKPAGRPKKAKAPKVAPEGFDAWWAAYPRKDSKAHAVKAYSKAIEEGADPADLLDAIKAQAKQWVEEGREYQFIKLPSTWLNAQCWLNAAPPEPEATDLTPKEREADPAGVPDPVKDAEWWMANAGSSREQAEKEEREDRKRYAEELAAYRRKNRK